MTDFPFASSDAGVWTIVARRALLPWATGPGPRVLCEGSPPPEVRGVLALDEALGPAEAWLDEVAQEFAERLAVPRPGDEHDPWSWARFAELNALKLRYEFVKLLRLAWFLDERAAPAVTVRASLDAERDRDLEAVLLSWAAARGRRLEFAPASSLVPSAEPIGPASARAASNPWWRRGLAVWAAARARRARAAGGFRVLCCGNPRLLEGVVRELLARGVQAAWLNDRLALRHPWRWLGQGVPQFVCDAARGRVDRFAAAASATGPAFGPPLEFRGLDLRPAAEAWLRDLQARQGAAQTRIVEQTRRAVETWRPDLVLLDEDATPLGRALVRAAREAGRPSLVVQHGAPYVRFGFAPLFADRFCAWGEATRDRLASWNTPPERIAVCGAPQHEPAPPLPPAELHPPTIVLLATVPPRDERPDSIAFGLTSARHEALFRAACRAVAAIPGARLHVRLHPRASSGEPFARILQEFPNLAARLLRRGSLARSLSGAACVLSCASTSGIDAARLGLPVVQLLPEGGEEALPAADWGFVATARNEAEIGDALREAFLRAAAGPIGARKAARGEVFAAVGRQAAARIAETALALIQNPPTGVAVAARDEVQVP